MVDLPPSMLLLALDTPPSSLLMEAAEKPTRVAKMARRNLVARVMFVDSVRSLFSETITDNFLCHPTIELGTSYQSNSTLARRMKDEHYVR